MNPKQQNQISKKKKKGHFSPFRQEKYYSRAHLHTYGSGPEPSSSWALSSPYPGSLGHHSRWLQWGRTKGGEEQELSQWEPTLAKPSPGTCRWRWRHFLWLDIFEDPTGPVSLPENSSCFRWIKAYYPEVLGLTSMFFLGDIIVFQLKNHHHSPSGVRF